MSKLSVGMGLSSGSMSISTASDKRLKASGLTFLCFSVLVLSTNLLPFDSYISRVKGHAFERLFVLNDYTMKPIAYVQEQWADLMALASAREDNQKLADENERLKQWYETANRLDAENQALRDLLAMKDDKALSYKTSKVLLDSSTPYTNTVLIRSGSVDGVEKGQGVLSFEGLIGRVIDVGNETSRVLLVNDVNSRIPVSIKGGQDRAVLAGVNSGDPILDHLPHNNTVEAGQEVVTSGHGGIFPYGVPVGVTYAMDDGRLAVKLYADPNRANHVQIVDYGVPVGSATRSTASNTNFLR